MKLSFLRIALLAGVVTLAFAPAGALALDPMRIGIRTDLPEGIDTIGHAAQYYGDVIGYQLVTRYPAPSESMTICEEAINPMAKATGVKPVEEAILGLLRKDCNLVIDHEHKLFSFENRGVSP